MYIEDLTVDTQIRHHFSDNVYAKEMHLSANHKAMSHKHLYSHLSIVGKGNCIVRVGNESKEYSAGDCIVIAAGLEHEIFAITDTVWFCIHATKETDPAKIDNVVIANVTD